MSLFRVLWTQYKFCLQTFSLKIFNLQTFSLEIFNLQTFSLQTFSLQTYFCIDVTFEMRTSKYGEICISIDELEVVARVFISNGKKGGESKITERQRERESVCGSVGRNPQQR